MQGFKNLISRAILADESIQPFVKKTDQHRKVTQTSLEHFSLIIKNIENSYCSFEKEIFQLHHQLTQSESKLPQYFVQLTQLFKNVNVQLKIFSQKASGSFKQLNNVCNALFLDYSNVVLNFQQHIRNYQSTEQIVFEMSKRYTRNFKNMLGYLESYKSSFTDARLIYNNQQKIKRYNICQTVYKIIIDDFKAINQKCQKLTEKKNNIKQNFKNIQEEMKKTLKVIGSKMITQTKNYVKNLIQFQKTSVTFLAEKKFSLQKLNISSFFQSIQNKKYSEYFSCQIKESQCQIYPALFVYNKYLKNQYIPFCKSAFFNYYKQANQKVQKRKQINKKIIQFLKIYVKVVEKSNYSNLKQISSNFQKIKKKISELFGGRLVSFIKSTNAIFQLSIGIHEKMLKSLNSKIKNIEAYINEENKNMEMFIKQLKINLQKFIGKKQIKKQDSFNKDKQQNGSSLNVSTLINIEQGSFVGDKQDFKGQVQERSEFLIHLITGFLSKLQNNQRSIKTNINLIIQDFSVSTNQFYSLSCEYEAMYFGNQQFISNYKKYQNDIEKTLQKQSNFFLNQSNFKTILDDNQPVIFDGQLNKIQEFKKLKKPVIMQLKKTQSDTENKLQKKEGIDLPTNINQQNQSKTPPTMSNSGDKQRKSLQESKIMKQSSASIKSGQKDKYKDFIIKKINFGQDEQFIKSFSCAFYDKIILQGRIYITNHRVCFHSKFNSNNVFFGGTFIQIPKIDIKKIQKRYNALIFDNSIAITTVNGQMFFTSFFARDQAYDLITKSLDLNSQEQFFEPDQDDNQEQNQLDKSIDLVVQQDDLKQQNQKSRLQEINKLLQNFSYQTILQTQIQVSKINAIKFFRLFDSGQEITHNRRTHSSFLHFCKDALGHKEIQIHHFKPNILQYLNTANIKNDTPIKIQRKLNAMVPISAAGVPFMPKAARSDQIQYLYFISKNKYIIESTIQNSGAPYTDCFNVKLRRTIQSHQENKIKIKVQMYVNFVKSTMMKSMIESKGVQQTKAFFVRMVEQVKKYFKNLQKIRKPNQKSNVNNKGSSVSEEFEQLRKQNDQLLNEKEKMTQQITSLSTKSKDLMKYLIGSIVLNVFLFLLLLS